MTTAEPTHESIEIAVAVIETPEDPAPRVLVRLGQHNVALALQDALRLSGAILDACDKIRNGATAAAKRAILQ